jgi:hypothetical protein
MDIADSSCHCFSWLTFLVKLESSSKMKCSRRSEGKAPLIVCPKTRSGIGDGSSVIYFRFRSSFSPPRLDDYLPAGWTFLKICCLEDFWLATAFSISKSPVPTLIEVTCLFGDFLGD